MKYRSVKHYLEEAKGVTQIGPKRILAPDADTDSIRSVLADIAQLKDELHVIRKRRRLRAMSRYVSPSEDEEAGSDSGFPVGERPTKRSRSASQDSPTIEKAEAVEETAPRPKLTVKLRKPPKPEDSTEDSLGPTSTLAAIMAWQNSLDAHASAASNSGPTKQVPRTRSSLRKKDFEARESHVWIKGAADQYESDSDLDMLDESAEDQDEMEAEERQASDDSTLTSLSELVSWRQSSPQCGAGTEAEERRAEGPEEEKQQDDHDSVVMEAASTFSDEEEEQPTERSEVTDLQTATSQDDPPPPPGFEQHFFPPMQVDPASLKFDSSYLEQHVPQLSYSADASSASTSSSADFGLSTRLASPWITNPYSAKGQGSLGVVSHFTHHAHAHAQSHPHVSSQDVSMQEREAQEAAGAGEEEGEDAPLYPASWPLRATSSTDSAHSALLQSTAASSPPPPPSVQAPHPTQMFFSPTSAWQHKTRT
jgi:hypothetical protein